ncbi:uncharacterized protein LOC127854314 isoform X1 [Dreissena polymorpha]|nr:uncharacterized protein LOC127854314 isoform X1 [Dreissena polymorpha]
MALAIGIKISPSRTQSSIDAKGGRQKPDIDFDLLVTRVENTIMSDKERQNMGITPRQLMSRSNPALFAADREKTGHDLTNPREMYNMLSHKTKSIEDIAAKFKQELAKAGQLTGTLPSLSRTRSMNDIDKTSGDRINHKVLNVSAMRNVDQRLDVILLNRHRTSVDDFRRTSDRKYHARTVNLPRLSRQTRHQKGERESETLELPSLQEPRHISEERGQDYGNSHEAPNNRLIQIREELSGSDSKLDKWFSEMPNEEFDKAQRAIFEDSIRERLQEFQRKRHRKINFPNQSLNVCLGSKMKRVPNTYLELRVDSFGKHLQTEYSHDKLRKYGLHQKSMHHLKTKDFSDPERNVHRDENLPRIALQHRSLTTLALTKAKQKGDGEKQSKRKRDYIEIPTAKGLNTVYMNDNFDYSEREQRFKHRLGTSNYEEYTERLNMMREASEFYNIRSNSPVYSLNDDGDEVHCDKDGTKTATIVNLALPNSAPKIRKPHHIKKTILKESENAQKAENDEVKEDNEINENEETFEHFEDDKGENQDSDKPGPVITKIPTAQSSRTSESKSTSSSILSNKEALKKFNKLEVFAEHGKMANTLQQRNNFKEFKVRSSDALRNVNLPQSLKLDTRYQTQPHSTTGVIRDEINIPVNDRKPEVVFRFEPGEVHITRSNANQTFLYSRSSERARVIYGKIHSHSKEHLSRKDSRFKEEFKDGHSMATMSTKLGAYKSDLRRFESRAVDGSLDSTSPRPEETAQNDMLVIGNEATIRHHGYSTATKNQTDSKAISYKRDAAMETDIIGSEKASQRLSEHTSERRQSAEDLSEPRSCSGLSDYIVENNDGESLTSDGEEAMEIELSSRLKSNHSV